MLKYLTGAAALALAAASLHADPGGGHGKGGGGDKGGGNPHALSAHGGGEGHGKGGDHAKSARNEGRIDREDRGPSVASGHGNGHNKAERAVERGRVDRVVEDGRRGRGHEDRIRDRDRDDDVRVVRGDDDRDRFDFGRVAGRGLIDGCPPGLAKKNNGCMPPGQLKSRENRSLSFVNRPDWWGLDDDRFDDNDRFAFVNGNLVRLRDDGGIGGFLPLLGGALAPGNVWPSGFAPVTLPAYYQDYYGLGPVDSYRVYDDTLFGIDPQTQAITSIVGLLTGDDFAIGQRLPLGYDVYNVPYSYRDRYVDGPDSLYRYSDGYVYQVDPTTQLITAAIQLLT